MVGCRRSETEPTCSPSTYNTVSPRPAKCVSVRSCQPLKFASEVDTESPPDDVYERDPSVILIEALKSLAGVSLSDSVSHSNEP